MEKLIGSLKTYKMNEIILNLRVYLNSINKIGYESLIINLIKISIIENDFSFSLPISLLKGLTSKTYKFDITEYIERFYGAIAEEKANVAKLYLNIITDSGLYKQKPEDLNALKNALNALQIKEEYFLDSGDLEKDIECYLKKQYDLLLGGRSIILLKNLRSNIRRKIEEKLQTYPDIDFFTIGKEEKRILVLRYVDLTQTHINVEEILKTGEHAFRKKQYEECIEIYKPLITSPTEIPWAGIYGRVGQAYLRSQNNQMALDYLTVSANLNRQSKGESLIYTHSLKKIARKSNNRQNIPDYPSMYKRFNSNMDYYYDMSCIFELIGYINETKTDIVSACLEFGLSYEQIDIVRLIMAREYFYQGNFALGEEFIKAVEQSPYKNFEVINLLEIVKKNKKFYNNREKQRPLMLSLLLKPDKN